MSQIPIVMGFAVPDRPREVRMEAAYFLQVLFPVFLFFNFVGLIGGH